MIIQATKKFQDFLGTKLSDLPEDDTAFECWTGHLFILKRKKCLLITHNATLYSVFLYGITKKDIPILLERAGQRIFTQLRIDGFSQKAIEYVLESLGELEFTKTSNRSVTANMNHMVRAIDTHAYYDDTVDEYFLANIVNRTPYRRGNAYVPREMMKTLILKKIDKE